ncbi:hypothetical protein [Sphingomonas sp. CFBP9019]|uniref:hypothetical protein n=1 Tax=Sphingomonas sp. CFBP9019 TaxID=3096532 RepID=UPI002A6B8B66|nr:hypothetical protein [Sphingomonas sp. CFBP9019]MDY1008957.1 hypothetical protein [Sphingomonas sp. CFBP9019]
MLSGIATEASLQSCMPQLCHRITIFGFFDMAISDAYGLGERRVGHRWEIDPQFAWRRGHQSF